MSDLSHVRLTEQGLNVWENKNSFRPDHRQVFKIKYQDEDNLWLGSWWGETCLVPKELAIMVVWDDLEGDWVEEA